MSFAGATTRRRARPVGAPAPLVAGPGRHGDDCLVGGEAVDAGGVPERSRGRAREPVDQPVLAVEVVHREATVGLEVVVRRAQGLLGEQEGLESDLRGAVDERERVGQGEQDQVVLRVGVLQEGPAVVHVGGDALVLVGVVGVVLAAELQDPGVDLDGVHVLGTLAQGDGDVRPRTCADDEHVVEAHPRQPLVRRAVLLARVGQAPVRARHRLVGHPVDPDRQGSRSRVRRMRRDLVVRRPAHPGESASRRAACRRSPGRRRRRAVAATRPC